MEQKFAGSKPVVTIEVAGSSSGGGGYLVRIFKKMAARPDCNVVVIVGMGEKQTVVARNIIRDITLLGRVAHETPPVYLSAERLDATVTGARHYSLIGDLKLCDFLTCLENKGSTQEP